MPTRNATNLYKNAQATILPVLAKNNFSSANATEKLSVRRKEYTNANNARTL